MSKPWRVEVQWQDSTIPHGGWVPVSDVTAPAYRRQVTTCLSVGFVLADDKHGIALAASIHGNEVAGVTIIPRRAIKKRRRLR